jgi:hypothetical protein
MRCVCLWLCGGYEDGLVRDLQSLVWPVCQIWGLGIWRFQGNPNPKQFQSSIGIVF